MNTFVENLRKFRLEKGYTQEQLAQELGVSAQSVSRWECGNTLPDVLLLPQLARILGITVDDFYRQESNAYANYASRLLAVYENTRRTEDFLAAEQEFTRLLAGEHTADDLRGMGVLYHYMTKRCAALAKEYLEAAIDQADRTDWIYSSAVHQKILLMCDLGRGAEEAQHYEQALAENPEDPVNWLLCVAAHHYAGELDKAHDVVLKAVQRFPENPGLYVHAGDICRALKRYDDAFRYWHRALELDSSYMAAAYSMGACYEERGQYGKAYQVWTALHRDLRSRGYHQECQMPMERANYCIGKNGSESR